MLKEMKTYGHMKPGQNGTHRLVAQFGSALVCVRYRYDELTDENLTTAEIIVDRRPRNRTLRYRDMDLVTVAVSYSEKILREKLNAAGGRWDPEVKLWRVRYGDIRGEAVLIKRIVRE